MKSMYILLALFLFTNLCFQCKDGAVDENTICYEFDQRQCAGDEWADLVPINDNPKDREAKMQDYLESKNIGIKEVKLVVRFHEGVCEACYVCPQEDRFFVKIDEESVEDFEALDLLNSGKVACEDVF